MIDAALLADFKKDICDNSAAIDPGEEYNWFELSLGYFIGKGADLNQAHRLALEARYKLHYWT